MPEHRIRLNRAWEIRAVPVSAAPHELREHGGSVAEDRYDLPLVVDDSPTDDQGRPVRLLLTRWFNAPSNVQPGQRVWVSVEPAALIAIMHFNHEPVELVSGQLITGETPVPLMPSPLTFELTNKLQRHNRIDILVGDAQGLSSASIALVIEDDGINVDFDRFAPPRLDPAMPRLMLLLLSIVLVAGPSPARAALTEEELDEGWIELFDGETLYGWKSASKANWRVDDGAIVVDSGNVGLLCTTTQFSDYVLQLEFRAAQETNSGVFLRTPAQPKDPTIDCLELNIAGEGVSPFTTGSLVGRKKTDKVYGKGEWQKLEVMLYGEQCNVKLDGAEVLNYTDPKPLARGFIGLQHNQGKVEFKNIKLKPLGMTSIFNGKDLAGWRVPSDSQSKFTASKGELSVKSGSGYLESEGKYGDFVLQLECITHAENLNSGIFFRCIPGEKMNGYESQIHNGTVGGDRTKPADCGTGGIFRRQNARRVAADDLRWFHKTIIADGPHMAVWVNGLQVSDWTDDRKPDPNPRRGLRTTAGTLQIQGHDPTTDLSFRNFRIAPLR